jgi:diguanylate cyclase (GGDEF)-like protein
MAHILIVDDESANLKILAALLADRGYRVHAARSGEQALQAVARFEPDLILLALMMPGIDGLETCRQLKQRPELAEVPVIFLTARDDEATILRGFDVGAVDYVTKPFNPRVLLARVGTHLKLREKTRQLERMAQQDGLTGINNRRAFDQRIDAEWRRCRRHHYGLGLLLLDIDYFKPYNDTYGHQQGDRALQRVAQVLQQVCHRGEDFPARYGGEEFVVLSPDGDADSLRRFGQRICDAVAAEAIPHRASKVEPVLTVSIGGVWLAGCGGQGFGALIEAADRCLYEAKRQGRNRVVM